MSERTFRVVISSVLVGALALAVIVVIAVLPTRLAEPAPTSSVAAGSPPGPTEVPSPTQAPIQTPTPPPVFAVAQVTGVGQIPLGSSSARTFVLQLTESSDAGIPNAPGSFQLTLTDSGGNGSTVAWEGVPVLSGPDSLGATAELIAPNVLQISIVASDISNVEPIRIAGLGISAKSTASLGPMHAELGGFTGSLAGGAPSNALDSPGMVVAGP